MKHCAWITLLEIISQNTQVHNALYGYATQHTEKNQFTPSNGCLTQGYILSAETLQGNLLGVNLAIGVCLPKLCSHPLRIRMCHSQTHLSKHFGCLRKAFSVLILLHYCQFWSPAHEFSEETLCLYLLTRSSAHRTPRFTMHCRLTPLTKQTKQFRPVASWKCLVCSE